MNAIEHTLTIILGVGIYYFADTIVEYTRYLPILRSARDGQNPMTFKIIGILLALYSIGMLAYTLIPRS